MLLVQRCWQTAAPRLSHSSMSDNRETGPQTNGGSHQCLLSEKRVHRQPDEVIKQPEEVINVLSLRRRVHRQTEDVINV